MTFIESEIQDAIAQIHATPHKLVLEFAGAGSLGLWWLHSVPGSSRTVIEATDRYATTSLTSLLQKQPETFVCVETARDMARQAYERAIELDGTQRSKFLLGIGLTATIATSYTKLGEHHCVITIQRAEGVTTYDLRMKKGHRDRLEEETLVSRLLVRAILNACNLTSNIALDLAAGENLRQNHHAFTEPLEHLMLHTAQMVTVLPDGRQVADHPVNGAIVSGSFNPLHAGHINLAQAAAEKLAMPVVFELPIVNADKGNLTEAEVESRIQQFQPEHTLVLSRAPFFNDKATLFPGCVFVIGYDTAVRLVSPHYYDGNDGLQKALKAIRATGCRFLVAGRVEQGKFHTLADITIPSAFQDLFLELPEESFRMDISSTEIRKGRG